MELSRQDYVNNRKWAIVSAGAMTLFAVILFLAAEIMSCWGSEGDGLLALFKEAHGLMLAFTFAVSALLSVLIYLGLTSTPNKENISSVEKEEATVFYRKLRMIFLISVPLFILSLVYYFALDFKSQNVGAVISAYCGMAMLGVSAYLLKKAQDIKYKYLISTTNAT